jgi:Stress responsive A/B Barrel Domain
MQQFTSSNQKPLIHQVFFWLKNSNSKADSDLLIQGIKTLAAVETVDSLQVGVPASTEKRDVVDYSWNVSETLTFKNAADQLAYQQHTIHLEFIKNYSHLWHKVLVYDIKTV